MVRSTLLALALMGCVGDFGARCGDDSDCPTTHECLEALELCWPKADGGGGTDASVAEDDGVDSDGPIDQSVPRADTLDPDVALDAAQPADAERDGPAAPDAAQPDMDQPDQPAPPVQCSEGLYTARDDPETVFTVVGRADVELVPGRVRVRTDHTPYAAWLPIDIPEDDAFAVEARVRVYESARAAGSLTLVLPGGRAVPLGFDTSRAGPLTNQAPDAPPDYSSARRIHEGWHVFRVEVTPEGTGRVLVDGEELEELGADLVGGRIILPPAGVALPAIRWGQPCLACDAIIDWDYVRWGCDENAACGPPDPEDDEVCNGADDDCNGLPDDAPGGATNLYVGPELVHADAVDLPALALLGDGSAAQAWRDAGGVAWVGIHDRDGLVQTDPVRLAGGDSITVAWTGGPHDGALLALVYANEEMVMHRLDRQGEPLVESMVAEGIVSPPTAVPAPDGWAVAAASENEDDPSQIVMNLALLPVEGDGNVEPARFAIHDVPVGRTALASSGDGYAIAWALRGSERFEPTIRLMQTNAAGVPRFEALSLDARVTAARQPSVVWGGESWIVVWVGEHLGTDDLFYARVSTNGRFIIEPRALTDTPTRESWPSIAWNGRELAVAYADEGFARLVHYDLAGAQVDPPQGSYLLHPADIRSARQPALAWDGTQYYVSLAGEKRLQDLVFFSRGPVGGCGGG